LRTLRAQATLSFHRDIRTANPDRETRALPPTERIMKSPKELLLEAARCRRLAKGTTDEHAAAALRAMADELEILAVERSGRAPEDSVE
jgi:hypothetical protein